MADSWTFGPDDDDDDDFDASNGNQRQNAGNQQLPPGLRKHVRKIEQQLQQAIQERDALKASQRNTSVKDIVKAKGFDPAVADLIPPTVEASEEALGKWLDERSALFAKTTTTGAVAGDASTAEPEVDPMVMQALGLLGKATSGAITPEKPQDLMARIKDPSLTKEQFDAILRSQGAPV